MIRPLFHACEKQRKINEFLFFWVFTYCLLYIIIYLYFYFARIRACVDKNAILIREKIYEEKREGRSYS